MRKITLFVFVVFSFISCDRIVPDPWVLPPNVFYYQITQNGRPLSGTVLDSLKFYYINEYGTKIYRSGSDDESANHVLKPSWISGNEILDMEGVRICMALNSSGVRHNTSYFEYPDGSIDTLYVESRVIPKTEGSKNSCNCITPFNIVKLNGRAASIHPTLKPSDTKPIWVLERQ